MPRPYVKNRRVVADGYVDKRRARVVEFGTAGKDGGGGLIAITNLEDGITAVDCYRLDPNVKVRCVELDVAYKLLMAARALIVEWQEVHVWGGDPIGDECGGNIVINDIDNFVPAHAREED